jgi:integrase
MLLPFWGDIQLRSITKGTIREYRLERLAHKKLTETTLSHDLAVVRHLLIWALEEGIIAVNPLPRLRLARARKRRRPILSWAEEQLLLAYAAPHMRPIILAAIDTGMRRGELLHQRREDVDLDRGLLCVTHSKTAGGEQREIPLTDRMRCTLAVSNQRSGLLFTFNDQPISQIKTAWKGALRRSGIRPLRFHDLRHTFNTRLLELGIIADVRKALMGHSLGDDPHALYSHVELPLKRKAIEALNRWIWQQLQSSHHGENTNGKTQDESSVGSDGSDSEPSLSEG